MALETSASAISSNVPGIQAPKERNTIVVNRQGSGASNPFAPQTNVLLKNAISNMQGILSSAAEVQDSEVNALPDQIQKMVQNILEKSFSLENTLAEGISSTVESQRFSADNLTSLARILTQLSALAEKGNSLEISDNLQALLKNMKAYVTANDDSFEPVMLHKLSFQLLDGKNLEELSVLLQSVLSTEVSTGNYLQDGNEQGSNLLKQLMKAFMPPRINTWDGGKPVANEQNNTTGQNTAQSGDTPANTTNNPASAYSNAAALPNDKNDTTIPAETQKNEAAAQPKGNETPVTKENENATNNGGGNKAVRQEENFIDNSLKEKQPPSPDRADVAKNSLQQQNKADSASTAKQSTSLPARNDNPANGGGKDMMPAAKNQTEMTRSSGELFRFKASTPEGNTATAQTNFVASGNIKNSAETMTTMKSLADLLMKDAQLSEKDTQLLQNFVNNKNESLTESEAKQLQLLLKICEKNIPASVRQAATQPELKELPKLWAFMELCDLAGLKEKKAYRLKKAARTVSMFANSMKSSLNASEGTNTEKGKSLSFTMPLYMGDGEKVKYPAYIHVYHDTTDENEAGMTGQVRDTWLRICCLTENIGAVELTCHLFDENRVDVALNFSQDYASQAFKEYLPDFKEFMKETNLSLNSFKVKS